MTVNQIGSYIITGGAEGRARLGVIARAMAEPTAELLDRFEPLQGKVVIDAGCGGGDVTFELARRVGPTGRAIGFDLDEIKLASAREEAAARGLGNVEFHKGNVLEPWPAQGAALVCIRFVLTHVPTPNLLLQRARNALAPGGVIVVQDIDYGSEFCDPPCPAYDRYAELFVAAARRRGADPLVGRKLIRLLEAAGFRGVGSSIFQPFGRSGTFKQIPLLTFIAIEDELVHSGLATSKEVAQVTAELREYTERADTLLSLPRIFHAWGCNN